MEAQALSRNKIITLLTRSPHGDLKEYIPLASACAAQDHDFLAHLIAWNQHKGQIRDSKLALPLIAMNHAASMLPEQRENAEAALIMQGPRELVRGLSFAKDSLHGVSKRRLRSLVELKLRGIERSKGFWRVAMQHREALKRLYAVMHIKPSELADKAIMKGEKIGVFADIANLRNMTAGEAAGTIMTKKIPFLVAAGALGERMKDVAVVQALIEAMTPVELVTNARMLDKLGVKSNPVLRAAYEQALAKASTSTKAALKTGVAAKAVGGESGEKLEAVAERQLSKLSVKGDWLILADRSSSMRQAIETARIVADTLARVAEGKVHLVWFNGDVTYHDVTGKSLAEIQKLTAGITASGGTVISRGLDYAMKRGLDFDGIVVISDGGENYGYQTFADAYKAMAAKTEEEKPVYFYRLAGDPDAMSKNCATMKVEIETFDLTGGVDYYSLPNIVQTMRVNKFDLGDEIMSTPLLKMARGFNEEGVFA